MSTESWPTFAREVASTMPVHSHYVLHGNVHDVFRHGREGIRPLLGITALLTEVLAERGVTTVLSHSPVHGLTRRMPHGPAPGERTDALPDLVRGDLDTGSVLSLDRLGQQIVAVGAADTRLALVIEDASRLVADVGKLEPTEHDFFVRCARHSRDVRPDIRSGPGGPLHNPVIWLVEHERDLPAWLTADNERVRVVAVPRPDYGERERTAHLLARSLPGPPGGPAAPADAVARFAEHAEGLGLREMSEIIRLVRDREGGMADVPDAVRTYKLGVLDSPWRRSYVRDRIADGEKRVQARVVGQAPAVTKTLDILKRAALGLSGAQASSVSQRPRGILFFAGPTGVGKTELAKAVAELIFGDESAYLRFDMSEFASEHAGDRLIGAPPGYVGFEAGGELTNALRQQPFRVVLFDEIEKAHERILDKFLQILEDGRLTDGRGVTTYFSESVLIFTSNLGAIVEDEKGVRVANVTPETPYPDVMRRVREAIERHFTTRLNRPELLNRFGDNIVVFGFVGPDAADQIFDAQLANIVRRVEQEQGVHVVIDPAAEDRLRGWCTADLSHGGRGIGTALESWFVNPLARALFDRAPAGGASVAVADIRGHGPTVEVELR